MNTHHTPNRPNRKPKNLGRAIRAALIGATVPAWLLLALPAAAQDTRQPATQSTSQGTATTNLEQIVVTAEKRPQSIQEVPMSISVLESSRLIDSGMSKLDDYYATVPGLSVSDRGAGRTTIIMRGISAGSEMRPTVGVMIDGAPFGSSTVDYSIPDLDPFDIDHIEVLRGPQGTLYGTSSMGGLINFVMKKPRADYLSGHIQAGVSSTAHGGTGYITRAGLNLPVVSDKLALRVSAFQRRDAGYVDDPGQGRHDVNQGTAKGGRISALWNLNDQWTVQASALAQNDTVDGTARVDMQSGSYTPVFGPYAHERLPGTDTANVKLRVYDLRLDGKLGWADFHSTSSYNQYQLVGPQDVTGTFGFFTGLVYGMPGLGVKIANNSRTGKFSQEFRLSSPEDGRALSWQGGVFYTREHTLGVQDIIAVDRTTGGDLGLGTMYGGRSPSIYKAAAAFGNATYRFSDAFDLQLGGRFSQVRQDFVNEYSGPLNGGTSSDHEKARYNVWTYSVSPRYHFNSDVMMYARVASGYRAGGANALLIVDQGQFSTQYKPDSLTSYEWGLKGDFADHKVTVDASLFYIDWKDIQLAEVSQISGNTYYVNASSAKSEGAGISLSWRPVEGLTIRGNTSYTHAVLTSDTPPGTYGRTGDRLPYSPTWSGNLAADYTFPLSGMWSGNVGAGVTYVGDRMNGFTSSADAERFRLRSYTTAHLHAGVQSMHWKIQLYVKNLTDARGYLSATAQNATTGVSSYGLLLIQPRTAGVSATYSF